MAAQAMFLNLLLDHDDDLDEDDRAQWQLRTRDSHECPEKVFSFHTTPGRNIADNVQFATVPLKFYGPDAKSFYQGASIYVLKRFATPDLLVLKSCVLRQPPVLPLQDAGTDERSAW
eukprot:s1440_g14.t1